MLQRSNQSQGHGRIISRALRLAFPLALALLALPESLALAQMPSNSPPVINVFNIRETMPDFFIFEGRVSDPGASPAGYVVNFGGVVSGLSATCQSDGTFSRAFWLPGLTGTVSADTTDPQGAAAQQRQFYVQ